VTARTRHAILEQLDRLHQRATYGALAGVLGKTPRSVMQGLLRNWCHSWIVNQDTGEPSEYHELQKHPALKERDAILDSPRDLTAWLDNPR
jgi:hypothetical protein